MSTQSNHIITNRPRPGARRISQGSTESGYLRADRPTPKRRTRTIDFHDHRSVSLLDEARRRLKSNVQAIASRLRLTGEGDDPGLPEPILTEMETRLQAMAALHKGLCRAGDFAQIDLAVFLKQAAALRNSPPCSPLPGGFVVGPDGRSFAWASEADDLPASLSDRFGNLETALSSLPEPSRDPARRAVYASAALFPPSAFRWGSPESGPGGVGHLARPGGVGIRVQASGEGVLASVSISDRGAFLPDRFDSRLQRTLSMELVSVLARLVLGSVDATLDNEAAFEVTFVPSLPGISPSPFAPGRSGPCAALSRALEVR